MNLGKNFENEEEFQEISLEQVKVQQENVIQQYESARETFRKYQNMEKKLKQQISELSEKQKLCLTILDQKAQNLMADKEFLKEQEIHFPESDFLYKQFAILKNFEDSVIRAREEESLRVTLKALHDFNILKEDEEIESLAMRINELSKEVLKKRNTKDFVHLQDTRDTEQSLRRKILLLKAAGQNSKNESEYSIRREQEAINLLKREILVYQKNSELTT